MPTLAQPLHLLSAAAAWPVTSQHRSRRNALAGSTALAQQRLQRLAVEEFLADHAARRPRLAPRLTRPHRDSTRLGPGVTRPRTVLAERREMPSSPDAGPGRVSLSTS